MSEVKTNNRRSELRPGVLIEIWKVLKQDKTALSGFIIILGIVVVAILAPVISPYDYSEQHILETFKGPSPKFSGVRGRRFWSVCSRC
jgi:ABC-type antimicrobial peptide transport system permease subunit